MITRRDSEMVKPEMSRPGVNKGIVWIIFCGFLIGGALYLAYVFPKSRIGPTQPIYFSHRIHAGVKGINCRFCHPLVERSQNAGLPSVQKCFYCHNYVIPNHPQIVAEKQHLDTNTPVPWKRIFYVPDFVYFNHQPHILWAKLDCTNCHGEVKTQDRLQRVDFQMGFCLKCHRKLGAQIDCWLACHR